MGVKKNSDGEEQKGEGEALVVRVEQEDRIHSTGGTEEEMSGEDARERGSEEEEEEKVTWWRAETLLLSS